MDQLESLSHSVWECKWDCIKVGGYQKLRFSQAPAENHPRAFLSGKKWMRYCDLRPTCKFRFTWS